MVITSVDHTENTIMKMNIDIEVTEGILFQLIQQQQKRMFEKSPKYMETMVDVTIGHEELRNGSQGLDRSAAQVKECRIKMDGNCLFGSIAHQLFDVKINSEAHVTITARLRQLVIKFIKEFNNLTTKKVASTLSWMKNYLLMVIMVAPNQ